MMISIVLVGNPMVATYKETDKLEAYRFLMISLSIVGSCYLLID